MKIADNVSKNRELAGVHYKSDTLYGKNISEVIFNYLKDSNQLQKI